MSVQVHAYAAANICDELLRACSHLPDSDLAQQVVQSMHGLGIPCGYKAHSYVLRALCSAGKHEVSCSMFFVWQSLPLPIGCMDSMRLVSNTSDTTIVTGPLETLQRRCQHNVLW